MKPTNINTQRYGYSIKNRILLSDGCKKAIALMVAAIMLSWSSEEHKKLTVEIQIPDICKTQSQFTTMEWRFIRERGCNTWEVITSYDACESWPNYGILLENNKMEIRSCKDNALLTVRIIPDLQSPLK